MILNVSKACPCVSSAIPCKVRIFRDYSKKKLSKIKNNFIFKDDFKQNSSEDLQTREADEKIVSSDLLAPSELYKPKKHKRNLNLSPLQYRGEILFGIHPVYLALLARKRSIHQLFLRTDESFSEKLPSSKLFEIEKLARELCLPIRNVNSRGLKILAPDVVHQGVCLDAESLPLLEWQETEYIDDQNITPLWIVLDEIIDPMNVGGIIRSSHYFGVDRIFTMRGNSCKLSPVVSKASSGALEIMDIYQLGDLEVFIQVMKSRGWEIVSTVSYCENKSINSDKFVDAAEYIITKPTILILGNEGRGVSPEIQRLCSTFVSISPKHTFHPGIDSLNVSVAAGVILHSLSSSRKKT